MESLIVSAETKSVIERAKRIYAEQLRTTLESQHLNQFVAIEPDSGDYFVGGTFDEAVKSARAKHPSRLSHTIRIGHPAAFHIGLNGSNRRPTEAQRHREKSE